MQVYILPEVIEPPGLKLVFHGPEPEPDNEKNLYPQATLHFYKMQFFLDREKINFIPYIGKRDKSRGLSWISAPLDIFVSKYFHDKC